MVFGSSVEERCKKAVPKYIRRIDGEANDDDGVVFRIISESQS